MPQHEQLLTSPEVALLLKRSPRTVHRMVRDGKLVPVQIIAAGRNGTFLFDPADIERLIPTPAAA
jgi:hypothetical protein